jgi:hypothetical protein
MIGKDHFALHRFRLSRMIQSSAISLLTSNNSHYLLSPRKDGKERECVREFVENMTESKRRRAWPRQSSARFHRAIRAFCGC